MNKNLTIADSLEKDTFYNTIINNYRYQIYSKYQKNKHLKRVVKDKLKTQNADKFNFGLFGLIGLNTYFNNEHGIEIGIGYGANAISYSNPIDVFNFFWGASYEYSPISKISNLKIYLLALQAPINVGLYPIIYIKEKKAIVAIRPELGIGYNGFSLSYGYNLVSNEKLPNFRGNFLSLRYNFMALGKIRFEPVY